MVTSIFLPSGLRVASPVNVPPLTVLSRPTLLYPHDLYIDHKMLVKPIAGIHPLSF